MQQGSFRGGMTLTPSAWPPRCAVQVQTVQPGRSQETSADGRAHTVGLSLSCSQARFPGRSRLVYWGAGVMGSEAVLASLHAALEAVPDDVPLRLHLAEMLATSGQRQEALRQAAVALQAQPDNAEAVAMIARLAAPPTPPDSDGTESPHTAATQAPSSEEVLRQLDSELAGVAPPMFVGADDSPAAPPAAREVEQAGVRLADVGGMQQVKARLEAASWRRCATRSWSQALRQVAARRPAALRAARLREDVHRPGGGRRARRALPRRLPRRRARHVARRERTQRPGALRDRPAQRTVRALLRRGRRDRPASAPTCGTAPAAERVNQLLSEMDGIGAATTACSCSGATNHPWDVDIALRRPGRFDRMLLVLPPGRARPRGDPAVSTCVTARRRRRPGPLAKRTDGYSGADLAHVCETAAERAMAD